VITVSAESTARRAGGTTEKPTGLVTQELRGLATAAGERLLSAASEKVGSVTERLVEYAEHSGEPRLVAAATGVEKIAEGKSPTSAVLSGGLAGVKEKVKGLFGRGKGASGKNFAPKVTNIVEALDVGVPVRVAYNQWTQLQDFPSFTKKVEHVEREADEKTSWRAQVWWSHRNWEATIIQQVPDYCIVWRSKGQKGHVDGSVTFHELTPNMTRVLLVMEYYPQGLFEHTGNLWRAQGRRARLEFKHYRRHVMTRTILNPDEVEGWRGEIRDGQVVKDHETALAEEREEQRRGEEEEPGTEAGEDVREPERYAGEEEEEEEEEEPPEEEPEARPPRRRAARTRA
jgi:uncharacterized membrane protein